MPYKVDIKNMTREGKRTHFYFKKGSSIQPEKLIIIIKNQAGQYSYIFKLSQSFSLMQKLLLVGLHEGKL